MRKFFTITFITVLTLTLQANNLTVSNVALVDQNVGGSYTFVQFDLSWDNSWKLATPANFWDAAYVFVKYRLGSGNWTHAYLSTNAGDFSVVTDNGVTAAFSAATTDIGANTRGMGAFIYRGATGTGSNNWQSVKLRWNYGENGGLLENDQVEVKVFAIEMIYIPSGSYQLGDGSSGVTTNHFYPVGSSGNSFPVTSNTIVIGTNSGDLTAGGDIPSPTTLSSFPTGFNPYYIMKYEITQGQYRDFLNTLTYTQQAARTAVAPNNSGADIKAMSFGQTAFRSNIEIATAGVASSTPAVYGCDLNGNNVYNEASDGEFVACNFLTWNDLLTYADWAGLRPMTELEYEKSCRGVSITSVAGEFAWGSANIYAQESGRYALTNSGQNSENTSTNSSSTTLGNCNYFFTSPASPDQGPLRSGIFATGVSDRIISGSGYYGVMEMSGNVWEMAVPITKTSFTGLHGDGAITSGGVWDVTWPTTGGVRGGNFGNNFPLVNVSLCRISDRSVSVFNDNDNRFNTVGGRLVRSAN